MQPPAISGRLRSTPTETTTPHDRVRLEKIDTSGNVTLRISGHLHKIAVGRTHSGAPVSLLVHDLNVRIVHATTGELLRELTISPDTTCQGLNPH